MLTIEDVHRALYRGLHTANKKYSEWSGGLCVLDHGVEHLLSGHIASSLYEEGTQKDGKCYVTLETAFKEILYYADTTVRGRPSSLLNQNGRCDVVYYDKKGFPVGLVEVKRRLGFAQQMDDIQRIAIMLDKCPSIRWGAIAAMRPIHENHKSSPEKTLDDFVDKAAIHFPAYRFRKFINKEPIERTEFDDFVLVGYAAMGALIHRPRQTT